VRYGVRFRLSWLVSTRCGTDNWGSEQVYSIPRCQLRWFGAVSAALYRRIRGSMGWGRVAMHRGLWDYPAGSLFLLPTSLNIEGAVISIRFEHGVFVRCNSQTISERSTPISCGFTSRLGPVQLVDCRTPDDQFTKIREDAMRDLSADLLPLDNPSGWPAPPTPSVGILCGFGLLMILCPFYDNRLGDCIGWRVDYIKRARTWHLISSHSSPSTSTTDDGGSLRHRFSRSCKECMNNSSRC